MRLTKTVQKAIIVDSKEEVVKCDECGCEEILEDHYSFLPCGWASLQFSTWDGCRNYKDMCPVCLLKKFTDIIL